MIIKRTERGWAGHFILADRCKFRRNTLLEYGDNRIIITTVGRLLRLSVDNKEDQIEPVGCDRFFETMVFLGTWQDPYWDVDVEKSIRFESEWMLNENEFESDLKANDMHESVVSEIERRLLNGEFAVDNNKKENKKE